MWARRHRGGCGRLLRRAKFDSLFQQQCKAAPKKIKIKLKKKE